jgi:hypothetical protein
MNVKQPSEAIASLEDRAGRKNIALPMQRLCTGCRGPARGHGSAPPVGPSCSKGYTETDRLEHLMDRMDVKAILVGAISNSNSSSLSSIAGSDVTGAEDGFSQSPEITISRVHQLRVNFDVKLSKVKSLIAQKRTSLNESKIENDLLHNELATFKRISSPLKANRGDLT